MIDLVKATRDLAKLYREEANKLNTEWLKQADPRAIEGGDSCNEAAVLRLLARDLDAQASEIEDI